MARKKQTFDPHALTREVVSATHEVVTVPFRLRTYRVIRKILIIFIAVSIVNVVFANVFYRIIFGIAVTSFGSIEIKNASYRFVIRISLSIPRSYQT